MIIKNVFYNGNKTNLQINNGNISILNENSPSIESRIEERILDAKNKTLFPFLVDMNVYPKNKILSSKALNALSKKALKGGVGSIFLLPNTNPKINNEITIEFIKHLNLDLKIHPLIHPLNDSSKISDISILHSLGGMGIYLCSAKDSNTLDIAAKYAKMLSIPLFVNAYDGLGGVVNYGDISAILGLPPRNPLSEIKEVAKMIEIAIFYQIKMVFSSIVESRSIELIHEAKKNNPNIYCETPLHHLIFSDESCLNYNTNAKINPPLKSIHEREILLNMLCEGKIDCLTSLQSACNSYQKELVFEEAAYGIDSISHYFPILYTKLVKTKIITLNDLMLFCFKNQNKILNSNLDSNRFMLVDLNKSYVINDPLSLYNGLEVYGIIEDLNYL